MKILHVNYLDVIGGAARAVYRLHNSLLNNGIDSHMLVQLKNVEDSRVIGPVTNYEKVLSKVLPTLDQIIISDKNKEKNVSFSPAWVPFGRIVDQINKINPDIVHLHWIAKGMIRIEDLERIKKPIVWTLHDMWPFTGGCHYDDFCGKFAKGCSKCPVLGGSQDKDLSYKVFKRKQKTYNRIPNLTIVALSKWLESLAQSSPLFENRSIVKLPNPIDCTVFTPIEKNIAKKLLNIPLTNKLILFGAVNATKDARKGFHLFKSALKKLGNANYEVGIFGSDDQNININFPIRCFGYLHDELSLKILYSAADVVVVPSLQEAFGQTASEGLACGTPVVSFDTTGVADIVLHQKTGYLAKPFDYDDLAVGIQWVLEHNNYEALCHSSRASVEKNFEANIVALKYKELYSSIF